MRRVMMLTGLLMAVAVPAAGQEYAIPTPAPSPSPSPSPTACETRTEVVRVKLPKRTFPNVRKHYRVAVRRGWPKVLVLNRKGASARTEKALENLPPRAGYDRDEYPPSIGRGKGRGARQGRKPRGWVADIGYVRSPEGLVLASTLLVKLARFCDGVRFRYVFT